MDPADFLQIADHFHASNSEAERRTSISRSYYALYVLIFDTLSSVGVRFEGQNADNHRILVDYLARCLLPRFPTIGEDLKTLRNARTNADYKMAMVIDSRQSEFAFRKARTAVDNFNQLTPRELEAVARCIQYLVPTPRRGR